MKKLNIGLFFSLYLKAPHNNKKSICAPMTLLDDLAQGLYKKGHKVYFVVSSDSKKKPYHHRALSFKSVSNNKIFSKLAKSKRVKAINEYNKKAINEFLAENARNLDIMHFHHIDYASVNMGRANNIITIHDPIKSKHNSIIKKLQKEDSDLSIACLSKNHSKNLKIKNKHILYNGINLKDYPFSKKAKSHLAFSGRMIKQKGAHTALNVAHAIDKPLYLAGSVPKNNSFFKERIEPKITKKDKNFGLVPYTKMKKIYSKARALLFPIQWEEAFGLVMIEAMACGTPVVAFDKGSVPEIIKHKKTGFIVKDEQEMTKAVKKIYSMPNNEYMAMRRACREHVEINFSVEKMVDNYEKLYYNILNKHKK